MLLTKKTRVGNLYDMQRGGNNPKHFNTTNLRKHLQSHNKEYKEFCEKEATKNEEGKLKKANFKQLTLQV